MATAMYRPEYQPLVDALQALMDRQGLASPTALLGKMFGYADNGIPKRQLSLFAIMRCRGYPGKELRAALREKFGFEFPAIPKSSPSASPGKAAVPTPARAAVLAHRAALAATPAPEPERPQRDVARPRLPPLFAMTIDQDGCSNVTMNLVGVQLEEAARAFNVLSASGLIKRGES